MLRPGVPLGAEDDQVGRHAARRPQDLLDRVAPARNRLDLDARVELRSRRLRLLLALGEGGSARGGRRLEQKRRVGTSAGEEGLRRDRKDREAFGYRQDELADQRVGAAGRSAAVGREKDA